MKQGTILSLFFIAMISTVCWAAEPPPMPVAPQAPQPVAAPLLQSEDVVQTTPVTVQEPIATAPDVPAAAAITPPAEPTVAVPDDQKAEVPALPSPVASEDAASAIPAGPPVTQPDEQKAPEPAPAEGQATESQKKMEMIGMDTVDIEEGGNWLLKRKALEDTVDIIEQINRLFTKILESRMDYKIKRNQLDSEYDKFIAEIGFELGDIDELLENLMQAMEKERKIEGDLSADERALLDEITQKKDEIAKLQKDLSALHEAETNINTVLMTVENQINVSNEHQNQAWLNFQLIKKILSDEKAEELYFNTENLYKSLQDIYAYLTERLPKYFNDQLQVVRTQMNTIKSDVQALKARGLDLQKEAEKLEQQDFEMEKKREAESEKTDIAAAVKKAEHEWTEKTWYHQLWTKILSLITATAYPFKYVYTKVMSWFGQT